MKFYKAAMFLLFLLICASCCYLLFANLVENDEFSVLKHEDMILTFKENKNIVLQGEKIKIEMGRCKRGNNSTYRECRRSNLKSEFALHSNMAKVLCLEEQETSVEVHVLFEQNDELVKCVKIAWINMTDKIDCINMREQFWYGGGEVHHQHWPIKNMSVAATPFVTGDFLSGSTFGPAVEHLWLGSKGISVFVERDIPLIININESSSDLLCLSVDKSCHPYKSIDMQNKLEYTICSAENIKDIYAYASTRWITRPKTVPNEDIFLPIWSTWAKYKANINQSVIQQFSSDIIRNGFESGIIEIDDKWESCYGDLTFDFDKFPDPHKMISDLKSKGFKVTFWIHPFVNNKCPDFLTNQQYLIRNYTAPKQPVLVQWWNGIGGYVDITNPSARNWMKTKLQNLKDNFGVDGFKWDAGEIMWLKDDFLLHDTKIKSPNEFSKIYSEFANTFGGPTEVRVAFNSQSSPVLLRMLDKLSNWNYSGGLRTIIPTGLLFSLYGYPFVLPDMIGGNNYDSDEYPEKHLFIRWFQAVLLFPSLQFSIVPWDYDNETVFIVRNNLKIREKYKPLFHGMLEKVKNGNMILNPLWMVSPTDTVAQNIDSEFLVDNVLLVAPVLERHALFRDIYLPEGKWEDLLRGGIITGPLWLRDYTVLLHEVPLFHIV